ncbi:Copper amine oxidase N-terminal domain-containing protein [Cohnella sp. OV330]|uniref:copper amine oxidase N-terminal domain-containing protein n=1 Tax=Cohnella sp. OV330 TaxID=1855288 RepID=UPI0008E4BCEB|nr:copper amine oxidase N-terminal domain-containing protein [Cohnella sp. OV330]SFB62117.1 Copper amine oxidase N-terminal domain-containing protein [Cohnella sp. OV330]
MKKSMKKTAALMLGAAIAMSATGAAAYAEETAMPTKLWFQVGNYNVGIDDSVETLDTTPYIQNGVTFVPFAVIAEKSGARINYDGKKTIYMKKSNNKDTYTFTIGSDKYVFNGEEKTLAAKLTVKSGRVVVPLRDIGTLLGWKVVSYDNQKKIVQMTM